MYEYLHQRIKRNLTSKCENWTLENFCDVMMSTCQSVNTPQEDSHNTLQCYQRLDIAVFSYLLLKNSALSRDFLLQAGALTLLVAVCTMICQFIHYCVSVQWFCNSHLTESFGYPITNIAKHLIFGSSRLNAVSHYIDKMVWFEDISSLLQSHLGVELAQQ